MKFERMTEPSTYEFKASVGDRTVEVLRSYPGDWFAFAKIEKLVCKAWAGSQGTYPEALAAAKRFLNREVTPETWES